MSEDNLELKLFTGRHPVSIDDKGRVVVPSEIRDVVIERNGNERKMIWVVTAMRNGGPYLACYDGVGFKEKHVYIEGARVEAMRPDEQWRILVKEWQRRYANLDKEIMVSASPGMTHFEIWNQNLFTRYHSKDSLDSPPIKEGPISQP